MQSTQRKTRFRLFAQLNGFPVELRGKGDATDAQRAAQALQSVGAMAPAPAPLRAESAEPVCPIHFTRMIRKNGRYVCGYRMPAGGHCLEEA